MNNGGNEAVNNGGNEKDSDEPPMYESNANPSDPRVDASTNIVGNSFDNALADPDHKSGRANTPSTIQGVIRLYQVSKQIYDAAMQAFQDQVLGDYDHDESGKLSRDEALDYFYNILDVKRQHQGLAIARAAAKIASDDDGVIERNEMEQFLYDLFTNELDAAHYESVTELGINLRADGLIFD